MFFGQFGRIADIYISRKVRSTSSMPLAFVRFRQEATAKAVKEVNGKER